MEIQAETLALLEWARLGEHLSGFAGSPLGQALCRRLPLAPSAAEASRRLEETAELLALDGLTDGGLSFQGVVDLEETPTTGVEAAVAVLLLADLMDQDTQEQPEEMERQTQLQDQMYPMLVAEALVQTEVTQVLTLDPEELVAAETALEVPQVV